MKQAIVTGASKGLGKAIAFELAKKGYDLLLVARSEELLENTATAIRQNFSVKASTLSTDLSKPEAATVLAKWCDQQNFQPSVLVNNAGINMKKPALEVTDQEFQQILLTNLTSVFAITREVAKNMVAKKSGSIINISSMAAQYGLPGVVAYAASKTAIEGVTRTLAVELSPQGVRVNCIAPGFIATKMSATALNGDPERKQKVLSRTPMGRLGDPQDVANAAYFLASDDSTFITGTVVAVDGGNSIGF